VCRWDDGTYTREEDLVEWDEYKRLLKFRKPPINGVKARIEKFEEEYNCRLLAVCKVCAATLPYRKVH
jgi:hypothetical protein